MSKKPEEYGYRALLRIATVQNVEHWEIQQRKYFIFGLYNWVPVRVVASREQAQAEIDRLERSAVIYPNMEAIFPTREEGE